MAEDVKAQCCFRFGIRKLQMKFLDIVYLASQTILANVSYNFSGGYIGYGLVLEVNVWW